jgi:hypothetical protein
MSTGDDRPHHDVFTRVSRASWGSKRGEGLPHRGGVSSPRNLRPEALLSGWAGERCRYWGAPRSRVSGGSWNPEGPEGGSRGAEQCQRGDMHGPNGQRAALSKSSRTGESALWAARSQRHAVAVVVVQRARVVAGVGRRVGRGRRPADTRAQATVRSASQPAHPEWPEQQRTSHRVGSSIGNPSRSRYGRRDLSELTQELEPVRRYSVI